MKLKKSLVFLITIFLFFINIQSAYAMLPPEFFSSGIQTILQLLGIATASFFGIIIVVKRYLKRVISRKTWIIITTFSIIIIVGSALYIYLSTLGDNKTWRTQMQKEMHSALNESRQKKGEDSNLDNDSNLLKNFLAENENLLNSNNLQDITNFTDKYKKAGGITSQEFVNMSKSKNLLIIDIRHKVPFKHGRILGSINFRFTDLLNNGWKTLSLDKYKYVIFYCFSGERSGISALEISNETGLKNIYFIKENLTTVIKNPDINFIGKISHGDLFKNIKNQLLSKNAVDRILKDGGVPIDCRTNKKFKHNSLPGAIHFFYYAMSSAEIDHLTSSLDHDQIYFLIYDSFISLYSALFTRHHFNKSNFKYIGLYNISSKKIIIK